MVPEISTATDFFCHLGPKYQKNEKKKKKTPRDIIILHKFTKNHDHRLSCSWDMAHNRCNYFSFWAIFLLFYPCNSPKNENFKKMKKNPKDIIILHKCTKNHDHKLYCSWDMVCDGCNCYFSFWAIFYSFNPTGLTAQKMKISKKKNKKKKDWRYHHFTQVYQKSWS